MVEHVDMDYRPREWALKAYRNLRRFSVLIVNRRAGKTVMAVMKLIDEALRFNLDRGRFAFLAPQLKQAKDAAWDYIRHYAMQVPQTRINEQELWVELAHNGARVRVYGADDPDSLRSRYFDGVVADEVAQMKPQVWGEILRPALADRKGFCLFIGTPKGINLLSKLYFEALEQQSDPNSEWSAQLYTVDDTQFPGASELEAMRKDMTPNEWRQEMLCDFSASSDESLISIDLVRAALGRHIAITDYQFAARVVGVDVALGGADRTVIQKRQGLAAFDPQILNYSDPQDIADVIALTLDAWQGDACFIDDSGGYGSGVISRLKGLGFEDVIGVRGGNPARDERYQDRNAENWCAVRDWLKAGGCLPRNNQYLVELTSRLYSHGNARGKLALEKKEHMRERGIKSPDLADALALTFAAPVHPKSPRGTNVVFGQLSGPTRPIETFFQNNTHVHDYSPLERFRKEQERDYG